MSLSPLNLQKLNSFSPLTSTRSRKIDINKLRLICSMAIINMSYDKLMEVSKYFKINEFFLKFAIEIIKKGPEERITEEISVLMKATANMPYFKGLNQKNRHVRSNTHEKICEKICYEHVKKGLTVMHYGDPADKFYIVLRGSVSIYVPRDFMVLQKEIEERKRAPHTNLIFSVLQKIFHWRAKLKEFITINPLDESPINRKAFKRLYNKASIQLSPTIIKHLTKDLKIDHEFYFKSSVIKLKRTSNCGEEYKNLDDIIQEESQAFESDNEEDDLEQDFATQKKKIDNELTQEFLKGFSEIEKPLLQKFQALLGEVPLVSLYEPEKYFQDGVFKYHLVGNFGPGNVFGEVGLLMRKPRSASVICNSDTDFAILTSEDYAKILEAVDKREMEERMEFFIQNLFQELQREVAIRLSYMFKKSKLMKGNYVYKQGEKANDIFLIKKGEVQIYTKIKDSEKEKKIESVNELVKAMYHQHENKIKQEKFTIINLSKLGFGQSFGEEDIIFNRNRAYNAVCSSTKVTLYSVPKLVSFKSFNFLFI